MDWILKKIMILEHYMEVIHCGMAGDGHLQVYIYIMILKSSQSAAARSGQLKKPPLAILEITFSDIPMSLKLRIIIKSDRLESGLAYHFQ